MKKNSDKLDLLNSFDNKLKFDDKIKLRKKDNTVKISLSHRGNSLMSPKRVKPDQILKRNNNSPTEKNKIINSTNSRGLHNFSKSFQGHSQSFRQSLMGNSNSLR